jgi:hypothetical protein
MEIGGWISQNWFNLFSVVGVIGGLLFTAISVRSDTETRRIENLLTLTNNQRELLQVFYKNLDLSRILDASADTESVPANRGEKIYTSALIQHLATTFRAMKSDLTVKPEGLRRDVHDFFGLPIPKIVWQEVKNFHDRDFVNFVENCLTGK